MVEIAPHIRIFNNDPTDEFVTKRQAAIKEIAGKFFKQNFVPNLVSVANGVVCASRDGNELPTALAAEIAASISKVSPSFVAEGHELELSTCAMLAAIVAIETGTKAGTLTAPDYLAAGIWSGLSWQLGTADVRLERLRQLLLETSRSHVLQAAEWARGRSTPAKPVVLSDDNSNLKKVVENLRSAVDTLSSNAAVDREEIDLLWWSIAGWSDILGMRYADAKPHAAALALGLDGAKRLRRMPIELHKALVLRRVPEGDSMSLPQIVEALGADRALLSARFNEPLVTSNPYVFPILNMLVSGSTTETGTLLISDLAARALLEAVTFDVVERRGA